MFYEEGSSLNLDLIVQNYEEDRRRYWGDDEQGRQFLQLVDQLAGTLLRGTQELVKPEANHASHPFSWDQVRYLAEHPGISERVHERLEINVAWEFSVETRAMAQRCFELAKFVVSAQPNAAVLRFLRRLTRCYIAGLLPECVMLCRSVVENAIVEKFNARQLPLPATAEGRSPMRVRLDAAVRFGLLSSDGSAAAWLVWTRGNVAVHQDPEAVQEVTQTIQLTAKVLEELYAEVTRRRH